MLPLTSAVTRSLLPSPLKSATATEIRPASRAEGLLGLKRPVAVAEQHAHGVVAASAVTRSLLPSPLKSPTATEQGPVSGAEVLPGLKRTVALGRAHGTRNVHQERRVSTDTGLDHHVTAPEDSDAVEARGLQNPPVLGLKRLRLLIDGLPLRIAERAIRGLRRKLAQTKEDVLERRGRTIGDIQEADAVVDVARRLSVDACCRC